ncbi:MAG: signal peptidase I [Acidimicrobiales bacterium]|nr:MAG: signal peptidase I [Acidimicrobiales bacterium]
MNAREFGSDESFSPGGIPSLGREAADPVGPEKRSPVRTLLEWIVVLGGAFVVAMLVRTFLVQAFYIPSGSMEPTLHVGDRVLVNKISYRLHEVHRGDLVVFERPGDSSLGSIKDLIKRVVGLPGETVIIQNNQVFIDAGEGPRPLIEPYLPPGTVMEDFRGSPIPEGHVFVMGDNRDDSRDSRVFGPIPVDDIVGRAFVRIWPPGQIGLL